MTPPPDHSTSVPLPEGLEPLDRLARNLAWTWDAADRVRARRGRPGGLAAASGNPGRRCSPPPRRRGSPSWLPTPASASASRRPSPGWTSAWRRPSWYATLPDAPRAIAYFSPEFGVSEALPQYSGGLGVLAGDHLKAASDLGRADRRRRPLLPQRLLPPAC